MSCVCAHVETVDGSVCAHIKRVASCVHIKSCICVESRAYCIHINSVRACRASARCPVCVCTWVLRVHMCVGVEGVCVGHESGMEVRSHQQRQSSYC
jgi:hypothetical protein